MSSTSCSADSDSPQEACGITAIFSKTGRNVSQRIISMQDQLQHRGRDAAGIAVWQKKTSMIRVYKQLGRVREVFPKGFNFREHNLLGSCAIGHNRYGTSGDNEKDSCDGAQPVVITYRTRTIAIAYNGNLPQIEREKLQTRVPLDMPDGPRFDTWDIARAIVSAEGETWEERIRNGLEGINLAYALTILTDEGTVYGIVCPTDTWPLWVGETKNTIIFASETRVLKGNRVVWKKIKPGELVKATKQGIVRKQLFTSPHLFRCALHDQYGARIDSYLNENLSYREFRVYLGKLLAREFPLSVDIYAGIPRSGIPMAQGYVSEIGKHLTTLFRLLTETRSFIGRDESEINSVISGKYLLVHPEKIIGKKVLLIDDSLIRGKTAGGDRERGVKGVVTLVRDAGAKEVHFAVTLPKFTKDCDMGYYIRKDSLAALVRRDDGSYEELPEGAIAKKIGADSVHFLSLSSVKKAYSWAISNADSTCMRCMGGEHPLTYLSHQNNIQQQEPLHVQQFLSVNSMALKQVDIHDDIGTIR